MVAPLLRRVASDALFLPRPSAAAHSAKGLCRRAINGASYRRRTHDRHSAFPATSYPCADRLTRSSSQYSKPSKAWAPVPYVQEQIGGIHHTVDLFSRLLKERIICLNGEVEDQTANVVVASLLFLEADNPEKPIMLYINSPGGSVTAGLAIYDTMQYIQSEVSTICLGHAASMGSLLLAGGAPGKRFALPHSSIMVHQPSGGYVGQASDIAIHAKEILRVRHQLNTIYKRHLNGKRQLSLEDIEKMLERDYFLSAQEALEIGIVDEILDRRVKDNNDKQEESE